MKKIKGFVELIKNILLFLIFGFWWVWALILILFVGYQISVSDLPTWFKFFLLN